jgi:hypothetical protein
MLQTPVANFTDPQRERHRFVRPMRQPLAVLPTTERPPPVQVKADGTTVHLRVAPRLDADAGRALLDAAAAAAAAGAARVDIDLRDLESFTADGARALVACRALTTELAEGLHYRTGRGPGRDALLEAYAGTSNPST